MTERQVSNWNVPNALTTLRILMVPFFGWALLVDGGESVPWRIVACLLFVVAAVTDKIDGDLARKHDLDLPISAGVRAVLHGEVTPADGLKALMAREQKPEYPHGLFGRD